MSLSIPALITANEARWQKCQITPARLREVLRYEPHTGKFFWIKRTSNRIRLGAEAGNPTACGHIEIGIDGQSYLAHRLAWLYMMEVWPSAQIDHEDTVGTNNKWDNLREATHGQNVQNTGPRKNNKCGFKGVSYVAKLSKWQARIMADRVLHLLGYFDTPQAASAAYEAAARRLHGEFARVA